MRASSSLRKKNYDGSSPTIGIFLYVAQAVERVLAVAFGKKLCWFESHYQHISLCSPGSERVLAVAFGKKLCWFESHYQHISLCSLGSERVLAIAFGNKLCWFESHYRHISLCSPGSWMCANSRLWNTQHSQKTDIHAPGGIRTHNLSRQGAVDRPATEVQNPSASTTDFIHHVMDSISDLM